jgi:hypothetical protein
MRGWETAVIAVSDPEKKADIIRRRRIDPRKMESSSMVEPAGFP